MEIWLMILTFLKICIKKTILCVLCFVWAGHRNFQVLYNIADRNLYVILDKIPGKKYVVW